MFSKLSKSFASDLNALTQLKEQLAAQDIPILDFTQAVTGERNVQFPDDVLQQAVAQGMEQAKFYKPHPLGQISARQAVAAFYAERNVTVSAEHVLMTPGSSLAYWYLFRLLANAGDEILCPVPTYPLFDFIAQMADVNIRHYPIKEIPEKPFWRCRASDIEDRITTKTKAIILISPHNPTGWVADEEFLKELAGVAKRHQLAIIHDEVFSEFCFERESLPRLHASEAPLVFSINGVSKNFALPGMKLGWVAVGGEKTCVDQALARLEFFNDLFLPVNEIAQFSLSTILAKGRPATHHLQQFVAQCRRQTCEALAATGFLPPEAGFYGTLRLETDAQAATLHLLRQHHVLVHPGHFYDMLGNHLVFSYVHEPKVLAAGLEILKEKRCFP